ncbi:MAG: F0F1 ATP synthase subunit epsilon [Candidatus Dasytiphilus stammeri]
MIKNCKLIIVSPEKLLFSGQVYKIVLNGSEGELGIYPGHAPLLTTINPGKILVFNIITDNNPEIIYISGGILEVQPNIITVLADTAIRGVDLDENLALEAKRKAEEYLLKKNDNNLDLKTIKSQLTQEIAKLRVIELIRRKKK